MSVVIVGFYFAQAAAKGDAMILSSGKNDFKNNRFDKFRWSANTYETPEEIYSYLRELGVFGKKVKGLSAIGAMIQYSLGSWKYQALHSLRMAGIVTKTERYKLTRKRVTLNDGSVHDLDECTDLLKNALTKRTVRLFEPLLILFEDGDVLELLPCAPKGLRIGFNTLPKSMRDGANNCEFDVGDLFNPYISGGEISGMEIDSTTRTRSYSYDRDDMTCKRNTYCFDFSAVSTYGWLHLEESACSEYELSYTYGRAETIKCGDLAALGTKSHQTPILEGRHGGGAQNIFPVKWDESSYETDNPEIISVCYHEPALYWPLMEKYFDPELPLNKRNPQGRYDYYYWNYYTKESIVKMVEEACNELERVRGLPLAEQAEILSCGRKDQTKAELLVKINEELCYTERFSERLLGMALNTLNTPEYNFICFEGP